MVVNLTRNNKIMQNCEHTKFKTTASINRNVVTTIDEDTKTGSTSVRYFLTLVVRCEECGTTFDIIPPILDKNYMEILPKLN